MFGKVFLLVSCAIIGLTLAAPQQDEVTALPGWDQALPSKHYSGYVPILNSTAFLHYWFIESEGSPSTDPVVLWLNGGPGSSSLIGLLTENGQFQVNDDSFINSTDSLRLFYNPYSWSKTANMLYLESPKGVGFSYCVNRLKCSNTDESTAADAYEFLVGWFQKFPEFASNEFYITGESYAGIYIPMLMDQISQHGGVNLKGAAIGNGCWGNAVGTCSFDSGDAQRISHVFYEGHAMIPQDLAAKIDQVCGNFSTLSAECLGLLDQENKDIGDFDIYNIYDDCGSDQFSAKKIASLLAQETVVVENTQASFNIHPALRTETLTGAVNDYKCGAERAMNAYLSQSNVIAALHVRAGVSGMSYRRTVPDLQPLYKTLIQKYRMVIYSGDIDACVPFVGSQEWTRNLGFSVKESWRPWQSGSTDKPDQNMKSGYVITYDVPGQSFPFTFITINAAGHLVPNHQPVRAAALFQRFLKNQPF